MATDTKQVKTTEEDNITLVKVPKQQHEFVKPIDTKIAVKDGTTGVENNIECTRSHEENASQKVISQQNQVQRNKVDMVSSDNITMDKPSDKNVKSHAIPSKPDTVKEIKEINEEHVGGEYSVNVSAMDGTRDTALINEIKLPKQVTVTDHDTGKLSVINNYDTLTEVSLEEYEHEDGDVFMDDVTDKFSEASIRIEERFECGLCASPSVIGRCDQCIEYLCQKCLNRHDRMTVSGSHDVFLFHCEESMKINKVVPAIGFCHMCRVYLCDKCVIYHKGFKRFRDHMIVRGAEMPVVRPKQTPVKPKKASRRSTIKSNLSPGEKSRSVTRLSDFSFINPMYQREPKLMWSERRGYFFKWFQY